LFGFVNLLASTRETTWCHLGKCLYVRSNRIVLRHLLELCLNRGSALSHTIDNLKANTTYEFRIQYKVGYNGGERSEWSSVVQAATESEPMTGETMYKAISMPGKDQLEKLLQIL
jgi:hypothetical protein